MTKTKREYNQEWYAKNKERVLLKAKEYYINNHEVIRERRKELHIVHKEDNNRRCREYQKLNCKELTQKKKAYNSKRAAVDPVFALKRHCRNTIKSSLTAKGFKKNTKTTQLLGCSIADFLKYLGSKPTEDSQLDHICPCSQARTEEEMIKLQHYTNFQWMSPADNIRKSNNVTEQGRLLCLSLLNRPFQIGA